MGFRVVYTTGPPPLEPRTAVRLLSIIVLPLGALTLLPAADPPKPALAPTPVTWNTSGKVLGEVCAGLSEQSKIPISVAPAAIKTQCPVTFDKTPFWTALQLTADKTRTRIALSEGGRKVELVPRGASQEVAVTNGAFRVVAQQVVGRSLLELGATFHEVSLLVHWEPRVRVYRIDAAPRISKVTDPTGAKITAEDGAGKTLPTNSTSEMKVRLNGLTRKTEQITALTGEFTVTAADRLLAFAFDVPDGKLPDAQKQDGVSAVLKRVQKKGDSWEIAVEVNYPAGQPTFQSFEGEWWLRDNRLLLRSPDGKAVVLDDYEIPAPDRATPLVVIHRYKEDPKNGFSAPTTKGWKLVYETPAPLVELKVPFELKGILLP
ncbi:Uncharacterized protein OS=Pirellula staleyi (strain ATCC 27377 / DSM 6068 / ICPB 4128) GN=Psta_1684 PE=4 SV=1 [Gemmata massiliana]|uniref:Uncharacterized protein n=1 Tax=Gemmata massiliana TaxID=1210884 RepID=A0A6P2CZX1_9BACT|nr:Uncharacterized protein OS=Pirellula staleyi (strain ATCC 27377 / DSM 6068 / ICPB 4128) GN=Psta_1684 PE=4 SV=1 [Gemmata massiliana]